MATAIRTERATTTANAFAVSDITAQRERRKEYAARLFHEAATSTDAERHRIEKNIVLEYLDVAESVARRYVKRSQEFNDIRQVAYVGLVKAAHRFDSRKGDEFVSFAVPTIAGEIKRHLRDNGWFIRPPRRVQELRTALMNTVPRLTQELGRDPEADELAEGLDQSVDNVTEALSCHEGLRPASLDVQVHDGEGSTLAETLGAPDRDLERAELGAMLEAACKNLTDRERRIVHLRFFCEQTQSEIAEQLGVTQMQISRLLTKILTRLRAELTADDAIAA